MKFLYTRRITIAMIFLALTMLGVISYEQLAMELLPNAEYPTLSVRVSTRTEMDPSYIESQAVQSIEGAIKGIEGIEDITTVINSTGGTITVSFKKSVNFKYASIKLQEKIREISSSLPEGFSATVQKSGNSRTTNSFITLQVRGTGGVDRVRTITDDKIIDELESIDGVASVNVFGGRERPLTHSASCVFTSS